MRNKITMPKLGTNMNDGRILYWCKKPGDAIFKNDVIAEIQVNHTVLEIRSTESGIMLEILVEEGQIAKTNEPIAIISSEIVPQKTKSNEKKQESVFISINEKTEGVNQQSKKTHPHTLKPEPKIKTSKDLQELLGINDLEIKAFDKIREHNEQPDKSKKVHKASPLAMKLARKNNVDLDNITGSGYNGKITEQDVKDYLSSKASKIKSQPLPSSEKTVADKPTENPESIPYFHIKSEINADKLIEFRKAVLEELGINATYNDIFISAISLALKKNSKLNSYFNNNEIKLTERVNIGMVIEKDGKLTVPVIQDCDKKTLQEVVQITSDIKNRLQKNKLNPEDMIGSTFSVFNLGTYEIKEFTAIVNSPETASLAIGAISKTPAVKDNQVVITNTVNLTLSVDYRAINSIEAAIFMRDLQSILENPEQIEV